jgi:hypothetical protein
MTELQIRARTVWRFSSTWSPEWLVPKCGVVEDLTDFIPIQHFAVIIRDHEFSGPHPFHRKLLRVLLTAVIQHLPIAVETGGVTVSSADRTDALVIWDDIWPQIIPPLE